MTAAKEAREHLLYCRFRLEEDLFRAALDAYAAAVERETIDAILGALRSAETGAAPQATGRTDLDLAQHEAWLVGVAECRARRRAAETKAEREALIAEVERETEARVRAEIAGALEAASKAVEARTPSMADCDDAWALSYWADKIAGRDPMKRSMVRYE